MSKQKDATSVVPQMTVREFAAITIMAAAVGAAPANLFDGAVLRKTAVMSVLAADNIIEELAR